MLFQRLHLSGADQHNRISLPFKIRTLKITFLTCSKLQFDCIRLKMVLTIKRKKINLSTRQSEPVWHVEVTRGAPVQQSPKMLLVDTIQARLAPQRLQLIESREEQQTKIIQGQVQKSLTEFMLWLNSVFQHVQWLMREENRVTVWIY